MLLKYQVFIYVSMQFKASNYDLLKSIHRCNTPVPNTGSPRLTTV